MEKIRTSGTNQVPLSSGVHTTDNGGFSPPKNVIMYYCENCHIRLITREEFDIHLFGLCKRGSFEGGYLSSMEYFRKEDKNHAISNVSKDGSGQIPETVLN